MNSTWLSKWTPVCVLPHAKNEIRCSFALQGNFVATVIFHNSPWSTNNPEVNNNLWQLLIQEVKLKGHWIRFPALKHMLKRGHSGNLVILAIFLLLLLIWGLQHVHRNTTQLRMWMFILCQPTTCFSFGAESKSATTWDIKVQRCVERRPSGCSPSHLSLSSSLYTAQI